ncbi:MAG: hypothetical protein LBH60_09350 [Prevotellaceae bacterium]|nr:hypothetical protein [Prevotellaceae bacterium]
MYKTLRKVLSEPFSSAGTSGVFLPVSCEEWCRLLFQQGYFFAQLLKYL